MTLKTFSLLLIAGLLGLATSSADANLKVLVVTGGHGFKHEPFFKMFQDNPEIIFTEAPHSKTNSAAYDREDLFTYDVVVLYDMVQGISDAQRQRFLSLFDKGIGLVVMHHALASYQSWPDFERIIGGRYAEDPARPGVVTPELGYEHNVDMPIVIVAKDHPITAGMKDFLLHDEIYWGFRVGSDVTPLIRTTHPKSGNPLAWTRTEKNSRVVYLQPGDSPASYENPGYRELLARSIRWAANERRGAWISLFDGRTLEGWVQHGGTARFHVEDGQIVGTSAPHTPNSFLCTTRDFSDFVLEMEFKVDDSLNSGVQIRSHVAEPGKTIQWQGSTIEIPAGRVYGYQVEIDPSARAWTGGIYDEGARGWLNDLRNNEPARRAFQRGQWNRFRIECRGASIKTWLNGVPAADLNDNAASSGFIGLQVHGVGGNEKPMEVRWRNMRLKPLEGSSP